MIDEQPVCMLCSTSDGITRYETDRDGDEWVYCEPCDCWTAHPPHEAVL